MNLSGLRDRILTFLMPVVVIGLVLGSGAVFVAKAYFWDVSRLTLELPAGETNEVIMDIQARIIYFDADVFGFYYPIHLTLPASRRLTCTQQCVFDRLPPGDAVVTVYHPEGTPERIRVLITPDTAGTLDLRPAFQMVPMLDPKITEQFQAPALLPEEEQALVGIDRMYQFQGLILLRRGREWYFYDTRTRQALPSPVARPLHIALGQKSGEYLFWTENGVVSWDRYGRRPMQTLSELVYRGYTFIWKGAETTLSQPGGKQTLAGYWSPIFSADTFAITDGEGVMQVR